jgi:hypothetical protein
MKRRPPAVEPGRRLAHACGLVLLLYVATVSAARAAPPAASIADLTLPAVTYSHTDQTASGTMTLTAEDTSGTGAGWNVTVQSSAFAYSGANGGSSIPAANFSITAGDPPTLASGQAIDPTGGPKVPPTNSTGTLDVARKTLHAEAGFGQGTYTQALDVSLTIPALSRAGTYTATLTVTIAAGP